MALCAACGTASCLIIAVCVCVCVFACVNNLCWCWSHLYKITSSYRSHASRHPYPVFQKGRPPPVFLCSYPGHRSCPSLHRPSIPTCLLKLGITASKSLQNFFFSSSFSSFILTSCSLAFPVSVSTFKIPTLSSSLFSFLFSTFSLGPRRLQRWWQFAVLLSLV